MKIAITIVKVLMAITFGLIAGLAVLLMLPLLFTFVICVKKWSMIRQNQGMLRLCGEEGTRLKTNRARPYKLPR